MRKKKLIAMLLAGGQGSRLGVLTNRMAKPAVPFGGKYRIIDFPLSNCANSDIDTVGVLTQYEPLELNAYIGTGQAWDLDRNTGGVYVLPPYVTGSGSQWYLGTANAIYQNMSFVDGYEPEHILILSGDHIYKMNYAYMFKEHLRHDADATIAVLSVPMEEASRFGIMNTDGSGRITEFEEKPKAPKSNKASMGIYIFKWNVLKKYLCADAENDASQHDFGKNVIPAMLDDGCAMYAYSFSGYWKDVGTVRSLWEANMDLITIPPKLDLYDKEWRIYGKNTAMPPHFVGKNAEIQNSMVTEGSRVNGTVRHSVLFSGAVVEEGAVIEDAVIMPNAVIKKNAIIKKAIIGEHASVGEGAIVGCRPRPDEVYDNSLTDDITLVSNNLDVPPNKRVPKGMIAEEKALLKLNDREGEQE